MIKNILAILASLILGTVTWLMYIQPGITPVKVNDPYVQVQSLSDTQSEVLIERNLLTQRNSFTGKVKIIKEQDQTLIRLEDIKQKLSPPACRTILVLLSLDFDPNNSFVLGKLKGTEGNMNYILPVGEDIKNYNSVMIWCKSYKLDYAHVEIIAPADKPLFLK